MDEIRREILTALLLFVCITIVTNAKVDNFQASVKNVHTINMKQEYTSSHIMKKRSLRNLVKRDAGSDDPWCKEQAEKVSAEVKKIGQNAQTNKFVQKHTFENETKFTMSLVWTGPETILVAVTEEMYIFAKPSSLYLSVENGKNFKNIIDKIDHYVIRKDNGLQKHPFINNRVLLVCHTQEAHSAVWITNDGGISFDVVMLPFLLEGHVMFYPDKECINCWDWMLAHEHSTKKLFYSKDAGRTWSELDAAGSNIIHFKWGSHEEEDAGIIYATFDDNLQETHDFYTNIFGTQSKGELILKKTGDFGSSWTQIKEHIYTFGMEGKFLYASVKGDGDTNRLMHVSTDGGSSWKEAQLPILTSDMFYSILDMTEGLIFMHVDNPGDTGHGTLYTSDSSGIIFSESLKNHLYPNYKDLTDFYKVESLRGVYIASQMETDQSIHTMITFNRGAEWKAINRPEGAPCKDESKPCYLQLANLYSISRGVKAQTPLSADNAIGIILAHGHVAEALQTTPPDVYVTSDGGYNWIKALEGPHHYQIADHGGLLVAIPASTITPNIVKFSTDEGRCWHEYKFTDDEIVFTGLLTEPGNKAASIGVWGFGKTDRKWRVHVIDFSQIVTKMCGASDYEQWVAHSDMNLEKDAQFHGCLLGKKETFNRLKKDAWCIHGKAYEVKKDEAVCNCSQDDYECDYGFTRQQNSFACQLDPKFDTNKFDVCIGGKEVEIDTQGYRKIPGDQCSNGFKPKSLEIDLGKLCTEGDKSLVNKELKNPVQLEKAAGPDRMGIAVTVIAITLLVGLVVLVYFIRKYNLLGRKTTAYKYSHLSQMAMADDNDIENALATSTSLYEDSSDDDSGKKKKVPTATLR